MRDQLTPAWRYAIIGFVLGVLSVIVYTRLYL
jgi:uncharacterized membrane-anchored protein YhcB (DUF1043 family)